MTQSSLFAEPESSRPESSRRSAVISPDGLYRYTLERRWGEGDPVNFVMLNPSTADGIDDDNTIKKCTRFVKAWGYGGFIVTNLFALRSTDPKALASVRDPLGPENDDHLRRVARSAGLVICAWGADKMVKGRNVEVRRLLLAEGLALHCLRVTKGGHPEHPLFLPGRLTPQPWEARP